MNFLPSQSVCASHCFGIARWTILAMFLSLATALAEPPNQTSPTIRELWVPSDQLDAVLKQKPRAVFLTREQYLALAEESHRAVLAGEKELIKPPVPAVVRSVAMTGEISPGAEVLAITANYEIESLNAEWSELPLALPATHLGQIEVDGEAAVRSTKPGAKPILFVRGKGKHHVKSVFHLPVTRSPGGESVEIHSPEIAAAELHLRLPPETKLTSILPFHIDGNQDGQARFTIPAQKGGCWKIEWTAQKVAPIPGAALFQTCSYLYQLDSARLEADLGLVLSSTLADLPAAFTISLPAEFRVLSVEGSELRSWDRDGSGEVKISLLPGDREAADIRLRVERDMPAPHADTGDIDLILPVASIPGVHRASGTMTFIGSDDVRIKKIATGALAAAVPDDIEGSAAQLPGYVASFQFPVQEDAPTVALSPVRQRFNTQIDTWVDLKREAIFVERTAQFIPREGRVFSIEIELPEGEEIEKVESPERADFDWTMEDDSVLRLTWSEGLSPESPAAAKIRSRRDPDNWYALGAVPADLNISPAVIRESEAVSGYLAVQFDPSFQIETDSTTGLEPRDGRKTPVQGNLAWFRLDNFSLDLKASRRPPELEASVTAYALPLANSLAIEGQIDLDSRFSGIRELVVETDPAVSPHLRFFSSLIAQQELDEDSGAWTLTFHEEQSGRLSLRYSIVLPLDIEEDTELEGEKKFSLDLPKLNIAAAQRIRGAWAVEANTDTELTFQTEGLDAVDLLRAPRVAGYRPRHRVIAAFEFRGTDWTLALSGTRHPHADLTSTVIDWLELDTVLSTSGGARHQARLAVRSAGDQFLELRLPPGSILWSLMIDGEREKPVRGGRDSLRVRLPAHEDPRKPIGISAIYGTPGKNWGGSGREKLSPLTVASDIPVMQSRWRLHLPEGYDYQKFKTNLEARFPTENRILLGEAARVLRGEWNERRPTLSVADVQQEMSKERTAAYYKEARSRTRSSFLREISEGQEMQADIPLGSSSSNDLTIRNEEKLKGIRIPTVEFKDTPLRDALAFLQQKSVELDLNERDPNRKGINIVLGTGGGVGDTPITLKLTNVPLSEALRYTANLAQLKYKVESHAVTVVPLSTPDSEMFTNKYTVPPTFLQAGPSANTPGTYDPFAPGDNVGTQRLSAKQVLENAGISFPTGATAIYNPGTSTLIVKNTPDQMELVEMYLTSARVGPIERTTRRPILRTEVEADGSVAASSSADSIKEIENKLSSIIIPNLEFADTPLRDALDFLQQKSVELDFNESDPARRGLKTILNASPSGFPAAPAPPGDSGFGFEGGNTQAQTDSPPAVGDTPITLRLTNVPLSEALRYTTNLANLKYRVEPHGIVVVPLSSPDPQVVTYRYQLPPEVYESLIASPSGSISGLADPFAPGAEEAPKAPISEKVAFERGGISFPHGSGIHYDSGTGELTVTNSPDQIELVEAYLASLGNGRYTIADSGMSSSVAGDGLVPFVGDLPAVGRLFRSTEDLPKLDGLFPSVDEFNIGEDLALSDLTIDSLDLREKSLPEAIDLLENTLREQYPAFAVAPVSIELVEDSTSVSQSQSTPEPEPAPKKFDFQLAKVTLLEALDKITGESDTRYFVTRSGIVIADRQSKIQPMERAYFPMPARVFQTIADDGSIRQRHARSVLQEAGIDFPRGASVAYNPGTGRLAVRNTRANLEAIVRRYQRELKAAADDPDSPDNDLRFSREFLGGAAGLKGFRLDDIGKLPIAFALPESGRVFQFDGLHAPDEIRFRYVNWERQIRFAWFWILVGMLGFFFGAWRGARMPIFLGLTGVIVLTMLPKILGPGWSGFCNSLLIGWLIALAGFLLFRLCSRIGAATALLVISAGAMMTAEAKDPPLLKEHTVYVPYDPAKPINEQDATRYYLDYETFQTMWKQVKALRETRHPKAALDPGKSDAFVAAALYRIRSTPEKISARGRLTVVTRGKAWQKVALPFAGANLSEITLDGKTASLAGNQLLIENPGEHLVEAVFEVPVPESSDTAEWTIPMATGSLLEIEMDSDLAEPVLQKNWPLARSTTDSGKTRFTAAIGQANKVSLRRRLRTTGREMTRPPSAVVESRLFIAPGIEKLEAAFHFTFEGQEIDRFAIYFDESITPVSFDIPNLAYWETAPVPSSGLREIRFALSQPARNTLTARFTGERLGGEAGQTFPRLHADSGRIEQRRILLRADGISVKTTPGSRHRQIPDGQSAADSSGFHAVAAYSLTGSEEDLSYAISDKRAKRSAKASYVYQSGSGKLETIAQFEIRSPEEPLLDLSLTIPESASVQSVQGNRIKDWWRTGNELFVRLSGPTPEVTALLVYLTETIDEADADAPRSIEPFRLGNFEDEEVQGAGLVVAHVTRDAALTFDQSRTVVREVSVGEVAPDFEVLAPLERKRGFRFERMTFSGEIALTPVQPRFDALWVMLAQARESRVALSVQTDINVTRGGLDRVVLQTGDNAPEFRVISEDVRETRITEENGNRIYEVIFQEFATGAVAFTLEAEMSYGGGAVSLPDIEAPAANRLERFLIAENLSSGRMSLSPSRLDSTVETLLPYKPDALASAQFFRARPNWNLGVEVEKLETSAGNQAVILYAELTTAFRRNGEEWLKAVYRVQNRSLQFLPVHLPEESELISVSVSGTEVRADRGRAGGQEAILVPLIQTRPGQLAYDVVLVVRSREGTKTGKTLRRTLDDPAVIGPTVEKTIWKVHLPEGYRLARARGNMERVGEEESALGKLQSDLAELKSLNWLGAQKGSDLQTKTDSTANAETLASQIEEKLEQLSEYKSKLRTQASQRGRAIELEDLEEELKAQKVVITENRVELPQFQQQFGQEAADAKRGKAKWVSNTGEIVARDKAQIDTLDAQTGKVQSQLRLNDNISVGNVYFGDQAKAGETEQAEVQRGQSYSQIGHLNRVPDTGVAQQKLEMLNRGQSLEQQQKDFRSVEKTKRPAAKPAQKKETPGKKTFSNARSVLGKKMGRQPAAPPAPNAAPDPFGGRGVPAAQTATPARQSNRVRSGTQQGTIGVPEVAASVFQAEGRRSVAVDFPVESPPIYFQKLKDHAELEIVSKKPSETNRAAAFFLLVILLGFLMLAKAVTVRFGRG